MAATTVGKLRSKAETAEFLSISIATLDRHIAAGYIEYFKIGWHVRFSDAQVEAYLQSTRNGSRQRPPAKKER